MTIETAEATTASTIPTKRTEPAAELDVATKKMKTVTAFPSLLVKRLTPNARLPTKGSALAAGYDLYSSEAKTIPPRSRAVVKTGLSIAVPEGTYGRVAPRSGLAVKNFVDVGAGVVDADYRGELGVVLFNFNDAEFVITEGDRIAQLIIEQIATPEVVEVDSLDETVRGAGGFGSTGVSL